MKKILFVVAFTGVAAFSTIEAKDSSISNLKEIDVKEDFCRVVTTYTDKLVINSDGSTTRTETKTTTFYPCNE
ncbi:hypothetical protein [Tenacibaculum sp. A30]|uniref:hypothetical protein n=1 Tax=Tenacibaculum sp. A30 TaxID=3442644 RepID=UPI003EBC9DA7